MYEILIDNQLCYINDRIQLHFVNFRTHLFIEYFWYLLNNQYIFMNTYFEYHI